MIRRKANTKEEKVLQDIARHGTSSVAEIAARLNMPKSTVYDAVLPLLEQSLINEYDDGRGKTFGVSDVEQIRRAQAKALEDMKAEQASLLSFLQSHHAEDSVARPKIKFYAGTLGVKQAFRDMMWQKDIKETVMFWPTRTMIGIDEEFFKWHGTQRFKYNVFIYAIELHEDRKIQGVQKHHWLRNTKDNLVEVRYLPKGVDCKMSFWLYGNKCLFASGGAEKIAFTVHSKEFAEMMKLLWQSLWAQAKK